MRVWLVQRAESTPHDDEGDRRLMRMGILADILQSHGHEVVWWTSAFDHVGKRKRYKESTRVQVKENYYIHYLKCFGYRRNISLSRLIDNQVVTHQFKKEADLDTFKPDILLTSIPSVELSQEVLRYADKNKIPIVLDIRDLWPDVFVELLPKYLFWLVKLITMPMKRRLIDVCSKATAISGITDEFINWGIMHSNRKRSNNDICFPMAYMKEDINDEKKNDSYLFWEKLGVEQNDKFLNVVFLGTFTKSFEFETIFSAAKILKDKEAKVRFIFCGTGTKEKKVSQLCEELSNCIFAGWVNASQIKVILELSDVGLAPYIQAKNFVENIPNKPAEYLSENLLIATSLEKGKLCELISSRDCGLSYGRDAQKLASFLDNLSHDEAERKKLVKNAENAFSNELDGKKTYNSMVKYLEKLSYESSVPGSN